MLSKSEQDEARRHVDFFRAWYGLAWQKRLARVLSRNREYIEILARGDLPYTEDFLFRVRHARAAAELAACRSLTQPRQAEAPHCEGVLQVQGNTADHIFRGGKATQRWDPDSKPRVQQLPGEEVSGDADGSAQEGDRS